MLRLRPYVRELLLVPCLLVGLLLAGAAGPGGEEPSAVVPACFVAGTPVAMADGSTRPIEAVSVGDRVLAYDEARGWRVPARVVRTYVQAGFGRELVRINGSLTATRSHPFYIEGRGVRPARELAVGDRLLGLPDGAKGARASRDAVVPVTVQEIEHLEPVPMVYNLEVSAERNFFADGLLVHNKTTPPGNPRGGAE